MESWFKNQPMKYFACILLGFQMHIAFAQRNCGSADYWKQQLQTDAALNSRYMQIEASSRQRAAMKVQEPAVEDGSTITVPVVVHILYNTSAQNISDAQVQSQLKVLNQDFQRSNEDIRKVPAAFAGYTADCQIKFVLAKTDPQGYATTGIIRKKTAQPSWKQDDKMKYGINGGDDAWDSRYYLNIWVCNLADGLLGYSTFPGAAADKDGVVIRTDVFGPGNNTVYNKGRTATHEIGHWLNLKHLWGDTDCGSDDVEDTPPQKTYSSGCSSFPKITAGSCNKNPDGDMFMNFMDFSDDACILMFTYGQRQRMRAIFAADGPRASMRNSPALGEPRNSDPAVDTAKNTGNIPSLSVYPNPSSNTINFRDGNGSGITPDRYQVFDAKGQLLMSGFKRPVVQINRLMQGIYFIRVQYGGKDAVIRFMKE